MGSCSNPAVLSGLLNRTSQSILSHMNEVPSVSLDAVLVVLGQCSPGLLRAAQPPKKWPWRIVSSSVGLSLSGEWVVQ